MAIADPQRLDCCFKCSTAEAFWSSAVLLSLLKLSLLKLSLLKLSLLKLSLLKSFTTESSFPRTGMLKFAASNRIYRLADRYFPGKPLSSWLRT